jgi:hypothetical protein
MEETALSERADTSFHARRIASVATLLDRTPT